MTSRAQKEANRENAKRSSGPRTAEGKQRSARNATKHGLTAQQVVVCGEQQQLFDEFRDAVYEKLRPVGVLEDSLVEIITVRIWRARRSGLVEASTYRFQTLAQQAAHARNRANACEKSIYAAMADKDTIVTDKAQRDAALAQAEKAEAARDCETLALAFANASRETDTWTKLSRYEVANERSLYLALRELERLQAARNDDEADVIDVVPSPATD